MEVYEVDPLWIILPKLPDLIIDRLRDIVLRPIPFPIPEPIPGPDPAPFARAAMVPVQRQLHAPPTATPDAAQALAALPQATALRYSAQVGSRLQFQQALIDHAELIRPLLCLYYPRFVTMQRVATAKTDECGHFQTLFFKGCNNPDQPDLYFKAKQKLFGWLDVYIYAPTPIACHTWWNYRCGTEVKLYSSSPWGHTCSPCPPVIGPPGKNRWVAFPAVGVHGLNNIYGTAQDLVGSVTADNLGLTQDGRPGEACCCRARVFQRPGSRRRALLPDVMASGFERDFPSLTGEIHHYYRHDVPADRRHAGLVAGNTRPGGSGRWRGSQIPQPVQDSLSVGRARWSLGYATGCRGNPAALRQRENTQPKYRRRHDLQRGGRAGGHRHQRQIPVRGGSVRRQGPAG
ncbi:MAG: hypothetical protein IPH23_02410 [Gammaproteobacteria bacterium]|nr:hypothetical protein [Gammaproteobacteria bacterium]